MSLALNDLLICCRQLEHDRATERRKEVDKFKRLIQDPETVQHLDRHSDSKQGKYLNWDAVFRFFTEVHSKRNGKSENSKIKCISHHTELQTEEDARDQQFGQILHQMCKQKSTQAKMSRPLELCHGYSERLI